MCILSLDVTRALALAVPRALKVYLAPGAGLAQAVRAGLPPGSKEPQVQQAIQTATLEAEKAKVSGSNQLDLGCSTHSSTFSCHYAGHVHGGLPQHCSYVVSHIHSSGSGLITLQSVVICVAAKGTTLCICEQSRAAGQGCLGCVQISKHVFLK